MDVIPQTLGRAAAGALDELDAASRRVARDGGGPATERAMAGAARTAIFADAVLEAMRARLAELRTVAK